METGKISVSTENIFPIIKKFLYSEQDIFLRELVSNAVDATVKLEKIARMGEVPGEVGCLFIDVRVDKEANTVTISDRGIGMTAEEIKKYINTIALSSAGEFLEKFKGLEDKSAIIGHFGLGFYSAFMVADKVEILSRSYKEEPAAHWICTGTTDFELKPGEKEDRGTDIILHLNADCLAYAEEHKIRELLEKYCRFLPVEIRFGTQEESVKNDAGEEVKTTKDRIINNTRPAWTVAPADLKEEDYLTFYRELYPYQEDPLFWIHLNTDYPFNLKGILFFPKFKNQFEFNKQKIHLYCNQVFVTDSIEQIVPEFLTLLQGVIDSPDIPLNVSRSYLQGDPQVKKITAHIVKKVADKLHEIFQQDRTSFEDKWNSLSVFVKYGMLSDDKFKEKANSFCLLENTEKAFFTLDEYVEKIKPLQTDKNNKVIALYAQQPELMDTFIQDVKKQGYDVLAMDSAIDNHFMQQLEGRENGMTFRRVDADTVNKLIEKDIEAASVLSKEEEEKLKKWLESQIKGTGVTIDLKALAPDDKAMTITRNEFMRRMSDMSRMGGGGMFMGDFGDHYTVVVNTNHALVNKMLAEDANAEAVARQLYDLARLSQGMLKGKELTEFIERTMERV